MSEEEIEQNLDQAASEPVQDESADEQQDQKMVPLSAMLATREKLREAEMRAAKAEAQYEAYQSYLSNAKAETEVAEDPSSLVEKKDLQQSNALTKREILESVFQDSNPRAVQEINKYLKPILDKKPWLAASVDSALNRYARAHEIVQDYLHLVEDKPLMKQSNDGRRIIENSQKPRSPVDIGKSARPEGTEYLKSIQGKKEFREYRQKVLRGET